MSELREIVEAATSGDARDAKAFDDTFNPERVGKMLDVIEAARTYCRHDGLTLIDKNGAPVRETSFATAAQRLRDALATLDTQDTEQGERRND